MSILKAFNNHLGEFMDDIILVFPHDTQLKSARLFSKQVVKAKPSSIINMWKSDINNKYKDEIEKGDYNFFINKDYTGTTQNYDGPIKKIQVKIAIMSQENKIKAMKYVQNLTKLCNLYFVNK